MGFGKKKKKKKPKWYMVKSHYRPIENRKLGSTETGASTAVGSAELPERREKATKRQRAQRPGTESMRTLG